MEAAESPTAEDGDGCGEVDFLSQLPDELLSLILSFLMVEDAVHAKLLSRRWRHLFPPNPTLCFHVDEFPGDSGHSENIFRRHPKLKSEWECVAFVDKVMHQFRAPRIEAFEFTKRIFAGTPNSTVDEWIRIACLMKAERIKLRFGKINYYIFPFHLLHAGGSSNLKHLCLHGCSLPPLAYLTATPIISLRTLSLLHVPFYKSSENLEAMPSCFPNLENLTFAYCEKLPSIRNLCGLWGQFLNLKSLVVRHCGGYEDFEISDIKITNFEYVGFVQNITFKGLNYLRSVDIESNRDWPTGTLEKLLSILPEGAPQLRRLSLRSIHWEWFQFPSSISAFKCLKHLVLEIRSFNVHDPRKLSTFLQVAPLLQEMNIKLLLPDYHEHTKRGIGHLHQNVCQSHEKQHEYNMHGVHSELKKVIIETAYFGENDVEFLIVLLKSATSLQEMILLGWERENVEELQSALAQFNPTVQFLAPDTLWPSQYDHDDDEKEE